MIESKTRSAPTDQVRRLNKPSDGQNPFRGTPFEDLFKGDNPLALDSVLNKLQSDPCLDRVLDLAL